MRMYIFSSPEIGEDEEGNHEGNERYTQSGEFQNSGGVRHQQLVLI